jgi:hypothetical protein
MGMRGLRVCAWRRTAQRRPFTVGDGTICDGCATNRIEHDASRGGTVIHFAPMSCRFRYSAPGGLASQAALVDHLLRRRREPRKECLQSLLDLRKRRSKRGGECEFLIEGKLLTRGT